MDYNERMKYIREENNLYQKDIAKILNISPFTYSHYETKDTIIPLVQLIKFCDYFNISLDYIFGFTNQKQYNNSKKNIDKSLIYTRNKEMRKENKLTQVKLATILNTSQSVIANYEKGKTLIALPFLYTICQKYKISTDYLLGKTNEPKYLSK